MDKNVGIDVEIVSKQHKGSRMYLYRISSVSIDKVTLEKHNVLLMNTIDNIRGVSAKLNDESKVGSVTQKMHSSIIAEVSKKVDAVIIDFEMDDKVITKVIFGGVIDLN